VLSLVEFPPKRPPIIGTLLNGFPVLFPPVALLPPVVLLALVEFVSEVVCATAGPKVPLDPRISPEAKTNIAAICVSFFIANKKPY
jgi:hypothetical protein